MPGRAPSRPSPERERGALQATAGPRPEALLDEPYGLVLDEQGNLYLRRPAQSPRPPGRRRVRALSRRRGRRVEGVLGRRRTGGRGRTRRAERRGARCNRDGSTSPTWPDHRIRVVDLGTGTISTFAGDGRGRHAGDGGPAASASIYGARAVEVGPDGTVWILERQGNTLRAVDPKTGIITTRAGTGTSRLFGRRRPGDRRLGSTARRSCASTETGTFTSSIRKITRSAESTPASGRSRTVAGDGHRPDVGTDDPATTARLDRPHGVAVAARRLDRDRRHGESPDPQGYGRSALIEARPASGSLIA